MKNLFFTFAAVAALTFTLASCKKDRTCTCTYSDGDVEKTEFKKVTKKFVRDEAECYDEVTTKTSNGITVTTIDAKCEID